MHITSRAIAFFIFYLFRPQPVLVRPARRLRVMDVDSDTLLEWLSVPGDLQICGLEQLCMLLLLADNVDRVFERCPPRSFLPALSRIFLDESATTAVLEAAMRAVTFYLDVSSDCTRHIVSVEGAVSAICRRLDAADLAAQETRDLAMQCIKVLELICLREASAVYNAGGLTAALAFITHGGDRPPVFRDALLSAMSVISHCCGRLEPDDAQLIGYVEQLSALLRHDDQAVPPKVLRCFAALADKFTRHGTNPSPLATFGLVDVLVALLLGRAADAAADPVTASPAGAVASDATGQTVVSLLSNLCRGSPEITEAVLKLPALYEAAQTAMRQSERLALDLLQFLDLLLVLAFEGRTALPRPKQPPPPPFGQTDGPGRALIQAILNRDAHILFEAVDQGADVNSTDAYGQSLLNFASALGTDAMVEFLCDHGADLDAGQRWSSLHLAAHHGRVGAVKILLR